MTLTAAEREPWRRRLAGPAVLLAIVLLLFGRTMLDPDMVVSATNGDIGQQFIGWRMFGFGEIARGHWPLWNPYVFCGQSFVGNWQASLFYPPNYLHLVLSMGPALTTVIAMHVYIAGLTMWAWLRFKGLARTASLAGAATYMLSAPVLGHVFPGHITWMCVVAWTPAIFHAVDGYMGTRRAFYLWTGSGALAMQVLAGYPQPVYITLFGAGLYCILNLRFENLRSVPGLMGMVAAGVLISAIQFMPGVEAGAESNRAAGTSWTYATEFSTPVKNFALALAPEAMGAVGNNSTRKVMLWEAWPYMGAAALVLAVTAGTACWRPTRRWAGTMAVLFALVAMGGVFYRAIYEFAPGGSSFRVPGRWLLLSALFGAVLAAHGLDAIVRNGRVVRAIAATLAAVAGAVLLGMAIGGAPAGAPPNPDRLLPGPLLMSGAFLLAFALALALARKGKFGPCMVAGMVIGELTVVAWGAMTPHSSSHIFIPDAWIKIVDLMPKEGRLDVRGGAFMNLPQWVQVPGLAGYDPLQSRRWVEYMAASQGRDPRQTPEIFGKLDVHPSWRLLRAGVAIDYTGRFEIIPGGVPHAFIADDFVVVPEKSVRLSGLMAPNFDARKLAIVEDDPGLPAVSPDGPAGSARVTRDTGDVLEIAVDAARPAMLVVTDAYAKGWRATREDTGEPLRIMPTDHLVRGVPLKAGKYVVLMEYHPAGYVIGRWVSLVATLAYAGWGTRLWLKRRRPEFR